MNPVRWLTEMLLLRRPERPEPRELAELEVKSEQTAARAERVLAARTEMRKSYRDAEERLGR